MDAYFPDDEEETGVADAPVDASGAFALSAVEAPTGGFQFVSSRILPGQFIVCVVG